MLDELPLILISQGWLHVDVFIVVEFAIEVCAIKVESVDLPVIVCGDGKNSADAGESRNWRIGVKVIYTKPLCETTSYKAGLVLLGSAVGVALDAENPFAANDVLSGRSRNVSPSSGVMQCIHLAVHSFFPFGQIRSGSCLCESLWIIACA